MKKIKNIIMSKQKYFLVLNHTGLEKKKITGVEKRIKQKNRESNRIQTETNKIRN